VRAAVFVFAEGEQRGRQAARGEQNNDVEGLYGLITDITDERENTLTKYDYGLRVTKLADIGEYSDITDAKTNLEV